MSILTNGQATRIANFYSKNKSNLDEYIYETEQKIEKLVNDYKQAMFDEYEKKAAEYKEQILQYAYVIHKYSEEFPETIYPNYEKEFNNKLLPSVLNVKDIPKFYREVDSSLNLKAISNYDEIRMLYTDGFNNISKDFVKQISRWKETADNSVLNLSSDIDIKFDEYKFILENGSKDQLKDKFNTFVSDLYNCINEAKTDPKYTELSNKIKKEILPQVLGIDAKKIPDFLKELDSEVADYEKKVANNKKILEKPDQSKNNNKDVTKKSNVSKEPEFDKNGYIKIQLTYADLKLAKEQANKDILTSFGYADPEEQTSQPKVKAFVAEIAMTDAQNSYNKSLKATTETEKKESILSLLKNTIILRQFIKENNASEYNMNYATTAFKMLPQALNMPKQYYDKETNELTDVEVKIRKYFDKLEDLDKEDIDLNELLDKDIDMAADNNIDGHSAAIDDNDIIITNENPKPTLSYTDRFNVIDKYQQIDLKKENSGSYVDAANEILSESEERNTREIIAVTKVAALIYLKDAHKARGFIDKLLHPIENIKEYFKINSLYKEAKEEFNNTQEFDDLLTNITIFVTSKNLEDRQKQVDNNQLANDENLVEKIDGLAEDTDLTKTTANTRSKAVGNNEIDNPEYNKIDI